MITICFWIVVGMFWAHILLDIWFRAEYQKNFDRLSKLAKRAIETEFVYAKALQFYTLNEDEGRLARETLERELKKYEEIEQK